MSNQEIPMIPRLSVDTLDAQMQNQIAAIRNDATSIPMLWQGLNRMYVDVNGCERTLLTYVPKDSPQGTMIVLMNTPEREDPLSFLEKSHWIDVADSHGLVLFLAEPGPEGWGTLENEMPYLRSCFQAERDADYLRGGLCEYMVGYGTIGSGLHRIAMETPLKIAGAVFIDASEIPQEFIAEVEAHPVTVGDIVYDVSVKNIPVPVWICSEHISTDAKAVVDHWVQAIGGKSAVTDKILGSVWSQSKENLCTPEGNITKVAVLEGATDYIAPETTTKIANFLKQYFRYGSGSPYGNTLGLQVDYSKVTVKYYRDKSGISRECLIYVPESFKDKGPLPLVFAIHGSSESCRNYFEESLLYRKADQEGFMLVMPEGILKEMLKLVSHGKPKAYRSLWETEDNTEGHSDIEFCEMILDDIIASYPVDTKRIYCTGHSMGGMMTTFIGSSHLSHRFAAMAITSGPSTYVRNTGKQIIPIYLTNGEHDLWDYKVTADDEFTAPALNLWLIHNRLATPDNVREIRISGASKEFDSDRHHCLVWENENQIPIMRYDWIRSKDHMNTPEENNRFWDEWFSKWTLEEENVRCYNGKPL